MFENVRTFPIEVAENQLKRVDLDIDYQLLSLNEAIKVGDEIAKAKLIKELKGLQSEKEMLERALA